MQGFLEIEFGRILALEPVRFDLQCVGIYVSFPEPFSGAELDVIRIDIRYPLEDLEKSSPCSAVFYAETDVRDPVIDFTDSIRYGQCFQIMGIAPAVIDEMPVAALQGKTERQPVEVVNQIDDRSVDHIITQSGQGFLPLLLKGGIIDEFFRLGICLQVCSCLSMFRVDQIL